MLHLFRTEKSKLTWRCDVQAGFNTGQIVNPLARGHIAYRTDDLDAFKNILKLKGYLIPIGVRELLLDGTKYFFTILTAQ